MAIPVDFFDIYKQEFHKKTSVEQKRHEEKKTDEDETAAIKASKQQFLEQYREEIFQALQEYHDTVLASSQEAKIKVAQDHTLIEKVMLLLAHDPTPSTDNPQKKQALQAIAIILDNTDEFPTLTPNFFVYLRLLLAADNDDWELIDFNQNTSSFKFTLFRYYNQIDNIYSITEERIGICSTLSTTEENDSITQKYNTNEAQSALSIIECLSYFIRLWHHYRNQTQHEKSHEAKSYPDFHESIYRMPFITIATVLINLENYNVIPGIQSNPVFASIIALGYWIDVVTTYKRDRHDLSEYKILKQDLEQQIDEDLLKLAGHPICLAEFSSKDKDQKSDAPPQLETSEGKIIPNRPTADNIATAIAKHQQENPDDEETLKILLSLQRKTLMVEKMATTIQKKQQAICYNFWLRSILAIGKSCSATTTILTLTNVTMYIIPPLAIIGLFITLSIQTHQNLKHMQANIHELETKHRDMETTIAQLQQQSAQERADHKGEHPEDDDTNKTIAALRHQQDLIHTKINNHRKRTRLQITQAVTYDIVKTTAITTLFGGVFSGIISSTSASAFSTAGATAFGTGFGKAALCVLTLGLGITPAGLAVIAAVAVIALISVCCLHQLHKKNKTPKQKALPFLPETDSPIPSTKLILP